MLLVMLDQIVATTFNHEMNNDTTDDQFVVATTTTTVADVLQQQLLILLPLCPCLGVGELFMGCEPQFQPIKFYHGWSFYIETNQTKQCFIS